MNMDPDNKSILDVQKVSDELRIRPEVYLKIVTNFSNSLPGKINNLSEAMSVNNADQMRMILHEIKGTAGNLRLHFISETESVMHAALKSGESPAKLAQYFEALKAATEKLQYYVKQLIDPTDQNE